jgi:hypothetical protein
MLAYREYTSLDSEVASQRVFPESHRYLEAALTPAMFTKLARQFASSPTLFSPDRAVAVYHYTHDRGASALYNDLAANSGVEMVWHGSGSAQWWLTPVSWLLPSRAGFMRIHDREPIAPVLERLTGHGLVELFSFQLGLWNAVVDRVRTGRWLSQSRPGALVGARDSSYCCLCADPGIEDLEGDYEVWASYGRDCAKDLVVALSGQDS